MHAGWKDSSTLSRKKIAAACIFDIAVSTYSDSHTSLMPPITLSTTVDLPPDSFAHCKPLLIRHLFVRKSFETMDESFFLLWNPPAWSITFARERFMSLLAGIPGSFWKVIACILPSALPNEALLARCLSLLQQDCLFIFTPRNLFLSFFANCCIWRNINETWLCELHSWLVERVFVLCHNQHHVKFEHEGTVLRNK